MCPKGQVSVQGKEEKEPGRRTLDGTSGGRLYQHTDRDFSVRIVSVGPRTVIFYL